VVYPPISTIIACAARCGGHTKLLDYHQLRSEHTRGWDPAALEVAARVADPGFPERVRVLLPATDAHFPADPGGPLTPLDETLWRLCELYRAASPEQRTFIRAQVGKPLANKLQAFAIRMMTLGVNDGSLEELRLGLVAHAIEDLAAGDVRDTLCMLAPIVHAARQIGADEVALFDEVAALAGPAMAAVLRDYVRRPDGVPSLSSMGYQAVETVDGLRYRQIGWVAPSPAERKPER